MKFRIHIYTDSFICFFNNEKGFAISTRQKERVPWGKLEYFNYLECPRNYIEI